MGGLAIPHILCLCFEKAQYTVLDGQAFSVCKYFYEQECDTMNITRKRVINPQRYLYALHPGDKFYIAVPVGGGRLSLSSVLWYSF